MTRTLLVTAAAGAVAIGLAFAPAEGQSPLAASDIEGFDALDVSAGLEVIYTRSNTYSIELDVERGDIEDVRIERRGDTLSIGRTRNNGWNWGNRLKATVTVTGPELESIEISSGALVRASGIEADDFDIDASSGANITVGGTCTELEVDASSGANINADDLTCVDGDIDASSGANIDVTLTGLVNADASSGANVSVAGGARQGDIDKSSGASVRVARAPL